ncbi:MAG: phosphatidate cytidylyltransferase [Arenimonas sp.]
MSPRKTRIIAALLMAPVAIGGVYFLPTPYLAAAVAAVLLVGLWEWSALSGLTEKIPRSLYVAGNALMMLALAWGSGGGLFGLKLISLIGAIWWLFVCVWLWRFEFAKADTSLNRSIKLLSGSLCVIPAWCALSWLHGSSSVGPRWALFALAIAWAADSGAYFAGVRYGKTKLAPRISPGKSWEGVIGGVVAILFLAIAATPLLGLFWSELGWLLLLTLVTMIFSVIGDLFESLMKRHSGYKDSSDLIPGHGGLMDRLDSLLAVLPIFVIGKSWLDL